MGYVRVVVQSALGARLDLLVSSDDNVYLLKCKIARKRGIPVSQQHLMFNFKELSNSASLSSYSIKDGSILKLVVSMKNGLISDCGRTISTLDHIQWTDLKHFLENNRDEAMEWLHVGCKGLVIDEDEDEVVGRLMIDKPQTLFLPGIPLTEEDCVTKCKMIDVQSRMRELSIKRYEKNFRSAIEDAFYDDGGASECPCGEDHLESLLCGVREFYRRPMKNCYESAIRKLPNDSYVHAEKSDSHSSNRYSSTSKLHSDLKLFSDNSDSNSAKLIIHENRSKKSSSSLDPIDSSSFKNSFCKEIKEIPPRNFLPPIDVKLKEKGKRLSLGKNDRIRCFLCKKRLSIATIHTCQCGGVYCAPHRYSEAHNCKYDYSKEWQTQLHRANPPAYSLPKLPKI